MGALVSNHSKLSWLPYELKLGFSENSMQTGERLSGKMIFSLYFLCRDVQRIAIVLTL